MEKELHFRPAAPADWPSIESLLVSARLPLEGASDHLFNFIVGEADGRVLCVGGFELYGATALLRSVAVSDGLRGAGVGETLLRTLRDSAQSRGVTELFLLTTTAAGFFGKRGFSVIARSEAPAALRTSREFQGVCPASATAMVAKL